MTTPIPEEILRRFDQLSAENVEAVVKPEELADLVRVYRLYREFETVPCPNCYDGGACLPGGCGAPGCERCGKMCPTCNGTCEIPNPLNPDAPLPAGREGT